MCGVNAKGELSVYIDTKQYTSRFNNVYDSLAATAHRFPDKVGLIDANTAKTYQQFKDEVDRLASGLHRRYGLQRGGAVGVLMGNSIAFLRAFYAIVKLGCTAVVLNPKQQAAGLVQYLRESGTTLLLTEKKWIDTATACQECGAVEDVWLETVQIEHCLAVKNWDNQLADPTPPAAAIMFTSGTTGEPKGALISHENILQTSYAYEEVQGLDAEAVTVLCVPVFHILGLSCVSTFMIYLGATLVLEPLFREEQTLNAIQKYRATHFHSAPAVFIRLARALAEKENVQLESLRICVCGGATLPDHDRDLFCSFAPNASFRTAYGMTETAGGGTLARCHKQLPAPCPGVSAMVVDEVMQPVMLGECGQVLLKGDVVISGYLGGRGNNDFYNGWLCTGDLARMNTYGCISLQGRRKELINRGGEKIFPIEVERALLECPSVQEAAVFAIPDPVYGEVPAAAVVARPGERLSDADLKKFLLERLAKYEIPVKIAVPDQFPRTSSEKIAKKMLADQLAEQWERESKKGK